ncbi:MAG: endonuclease/exonuclease/phosphatase family protein [Cyanobacteria bacterium P01_F01_bin.143]
MKDLLKFVSISLLAITLLLVLPCQPSQAEIVRIMAANTSSGNRQAYEDPGIRIFQGLEPDIVLIQEFSYEQGTIEQLVENAFGPDAFFHREDIQGDTENPLPNGIISLYPIIDRGEIEDNNISNRDFPWVKIDIPGDTDLWVVSVHFKANSNSKSRRNAQANSLIDELQDLVPPEDYLIIGGDFNTSNRSEQALESLDTLVNTSGPDYPVDSFGDPDTNSSRKKPYDAIYADVDLEEQEVPVVIGSNIFPNGLVFDSRVYSPLSEVAPIQQGDSGVTGMQHMAVVRDFDF